MSWVFSCCCGTLTAADDKAQPLLESEAIEMKRKKRTKMTQERFTLTTSRRALPLPKLHLLYPRPR